MLLCVCVSEGVRQGQQGWALGQGENLPYSGMCRELPTAHTGLPKLLPGCWLLQS